MSEGNDSSGWKLLDQTPLCETPHLRVACEKLATPSRPGGVDWVVVHRPRAVVVAPRLENGNFVLIRQERPAVRMTTWEFPAGQRDANGESAEATGHRELAEEAGLVTDRSLIPLGFFFPSVGFTDECSDLFLAEDCRHEHGMLSPDEHEAISGILEVTAAEFSAMVARGEIFDANTLSAFARMVAMGLIAT